MDEHTENVLSWKPYVWRAAGGGAIGSIVVLLVYTAYVWFSVDSHIRGHLVGPFVWAGVGEIIFAVIIGLVIGFLIFALTRRSGKQPNIALRVAVGAGCILAFLLLRDLTHYGPSLFLFDLGYAAAVGGLAGLMANPSMNPGSASITSRA